MMTTSFAPRYFFFFVLALLVVLGIVLAVLRARGRRKDALPPPTGTDGTHGPAGTSAEGPEL